MLMKSLAPDELGMPHRKAIPYDSSHQWDCGNHQIVCGINHLCLNVELQGSTAIDEIDCNGRSPFLYAVKHRRVGYVRVLLKYGADPNLAILLFGRLQQDAPTSRFLNCFSVMARVSILLSVLQVLLTGCHGLSLIPTITM